MNDWRMYTDASGSEQTHVAWHEVLKEIAQLNGTTHSLVHAAFGDHVDLVVAGGNDGQVLLQWKEYQPAERHYVLMSEQADDSEASHLTIEGSMIELPASWCISLEQAVPICGDLLRNCVMGEYEELSWLLIDPKGPTVS